MIGEWGTLGYRPDPFGDIVPKPLLRFAAVYDVESFEPYFSVQTRFNCRMLCILL